MSCPVGVSLTDPECSSIKAVDSLDVYSLTYESQRPALPTDVSSLPVSVQTALEGCNTPGCKAISHDFSAPTNQPRVVSSLPFIYSTKLSRPLDNAIIMKDTISPPPVFTSLPGYDFFSYPFEKRNLMNGDTVKVTYTGVDAAGNNLDKCADTCSNGSDCAGFNFISAVGTCEFFPTGAASSAQMDKTQLASDEWVKSFDSSGQGVAYRKKPVIGGLGTNSTIPSAINLLSTGVFCKDYTKCNTVVSNIIAAGELSQFITSDLDECSRCPSRKYETNGTLYTVTNEMNLSTTESSKDLAKSKILYTSGSGAAHNNPDFTRDRIVIIKKIDGTLMFSGFNSNVNGTGTVSANWRNSKGDARNVRYEPVDYVTDGYMIYDVKDNYNYCDATKTFEQTTDPKYSPIYTSNVYVIVDDPVQTLRGGLYLRISRDPVPALVQPTVNGTNWSLAISVYFNNSVPKQWVRIIGAGQHPGFPGIWTHATDANNIRVHFGDMAIDYTAGSIIPNVYHNLLITYDGSGSTKMATIYKEGVRVDGQTSSSLVVLQTPWVWNQQTYVGSDIHVKNVYWWNKTLTTNEARSVGASGGIDVLPWGYIKLINSETTLTSSNPDILVANQPGGFAYDVQPVKYTISFRIKLTGESPTTWREILQNTGNPSWDNGLNAHTLDANAPLFFVGPGSHSYWVNRLGFRQLLDDNTYKEVNTQGALLNNRWYTITGVADTDKLILYKDGIKVDETATGDTRLLRSRNRNNFVWNPNPYGEYTPVVINDAYLWNKALSAMEVMTLSVFSESDGLTSSTAAPNALYLKGQYPAYTDGVYWINCGGTPTQTYCLMDSKWDGGGWMLIMKAARGSTFNWGSSYWTTTNTLNPADTSTTIADAKFNAFNSVPVTDVMAVWPASEVGAGNTGGSLAVSDGWVWLVKDWYTRAITPLEGFQIDRDATPPDIFNFSGFSITSPIWSYQMSTRSHIFGSGAHINGPDDHLARWGFIWNNEVDTTATQDAFAGIGLSAPSSSGGDFYFWGGVDKRGVNRNIAWLMYGR